uniref:Putative secreted peptide n=1 Tax=Anopheles braziliensis TaxID=58242 RepID=A0A2M3ZQU6_9DIPT
MLWSFNGASVLVCCCCCCWSAAGGKCGPLPVVSRLAWVAGEFASNRADGTPPASRCRSTSHSNRSRYSTYSVSCSSSFDSSAIRCLCRSRLAFTSCSHASESELCGKRCTHMRWKSLNTLIVYTHTRARAGLTA